jgi:asparagine synthase (glutamine-hydrolysing)
MCPSGEAWLGHRRLAIVDLTAAGNQPMRNEDGTIRLVCNGEIYNYSSLRGRLEGLGHRFLSNSDSEAILHAYEEWDGACVEHLEGMFSFAVWDQDRRRLLAARDRVGIKPLYYCERAGGLALASEACALEGILDKCLQPEPSAVAYTMTLGYVPSPWSIWRGVFKLEPGHLLTWDKSRGTRLSRYWEPPGDLNGRAAQGWDDLFEGVLQEHMMSDVPIGLFLSGGLDSTSVALGLHRLGRRVEAITIGFSGSAASEEAVAGAVAERLGFAHEVIPIEIRDVDALIRETNAAYDEPQGYSALLTMYKVCAAAAGLCKVVLAGDGGDEVFGGYTWYANLRRGPLARVRHTTQAIRSFLSDGSRRRENARWDAFAARSVLHQHVRRLFPRFFADEVERLMAPAGLRFSEDELLAPLEKHFVPSLPLKRALQRVDLMTFCSDSILAKVDRASMAHSLEVRVPFLDRRIVEFGLALPVERGPRGWQGKRVLRQYLEGNVPPQVLCHPKQGFSMRVLDGFDFDTAVEEIRQGPWVRNGLWRDDLESLLAPGGAYREGRIWTLLMMTRWAEARECGASQVVTSGNTACR